MSAPTRWVSDRTDPATLPPSCPGVRTGATGIPRLCPAWRLTATVRSDITAAVGSMGTGFIRPPSTSSRPSTTIGVTRLGIATEARTAVATGPRWNHTSRRALRSVATAVNGMAQSSMSAPPRMSPTRLKMRSARIAPPPPRFMSRSRQTSYWVRPVTHSV